MSSAFLTLYLIVFIIPMVLICIYQYITYRKQEREYKQQVETNKRRAMLRIVNGGENEE